MASYPARLVGEHVPRDSARIEVRTSTRRHRALVHGDVAAVVLGVLGYRLDEPGHRLPAAEFLARARAWQARHDPTLIPDPDSVEEITWMPDQVATETYDRCPAAFRPAFSAFTITSRPPEATDWISWRPG